MESFFGIGGSELLLILVLATIILGPLNMIKMARQLGILLRDLRNYYSSFTANLSQELGELAELRETITSEVTSVMPKLEELQVTVPDLAAEAQRVLNAPAPSQPEAGSSESASSAQSQPEATPVPSPYEAVSQPQEPDQARTAYNS